MSHSCYVFKGEPLMYLSSQYKTIRLIGEERINISNVQLDIP